MPQHAGKEARWSAFCALREATSTPRRRPRHSARSTPSGSRRCRSSTSTNNIIQTAVPVEDLYTNQFVSYKRERRDVRRGTPPPTPNPPHSVVFTPAYGGAARPRRPRALRSRSSFCRLAISAADVWRSEIHHPARLRPVDRRRAACGRRRICCGTSFRRRRCQSSASSSAACSAPSPATRSACCRRGKGAVALHPRAADRAEGRLRAAVHFVVRLQRLAQADRDDPGRVLPDPRQRACRPCA